MAKALDFCYDEHMGTWKLFERLKKRTALAKSMMREQEIEPGLLQLLRVYIIFLIVLFAFNLLGLSLAGELTFSVLMLLYAVTAFVLVVFLYNRWLRVKLKTAYIGVSLLLFLLMALLQFWLGLQQSQPLRLEEWIGLYYSTGFTLLFIPLLVAAWQYGLPGVMAFILAASLGETGVFFAVDPARQDVYMLAIIFLRGINFLIIGAVVARLMMAQRRQRHELKAANQQLTHYAATLEQLAVSRERNRLARDLHDTLAHTLSGVSVQLEAVRALWEQNPGQAYTLLEQALSDTRSGLNETRRALQDLRAGAVENLGLLLALEQLADGFRERSAVPCELTLPDDLSVASPAVQNALYRSAQEALLNIDRHAGARHARLTLTAENSEGEFSYCLTIHDDGQGFEPNSAIQDGHYGLRGIKERAELLGGDCAVISAPGSGTQVKITLKEKP